MRLTTKGPESSATSLAHMGDQAVEVLACLALCTAHILSASHLLLLKEF